MKTRSEECIRSIREDVTGQLGVKPLKIVRFEDEKEGHRGQSLQSQQEPKMSRCPNYRKCKGMINKLIKHNTLGKNNKNNDRSYCLQSFFLF